MHIADGGLFIPRVEGEDKKRVALVLNMPKDYGLESENGRVQPIEVKVVHHYLNSFFFNH